MISIDDLDRVLGWMLEQGLQSVSLTDGDAHLMLRLAGAVAAAPSPAVTREVKTRAMGRFLPAHPGRPDSALKLGERVVAGSIVGFLQAGPTLAPVTSDAAGTVTAILATPGALLGYGMPVITLAQDVADAN